MSETIPEYEIISEIGSGAFGQVFEAYDYIKDKRVAIKRTRKSSDKISREYQILNMLKDSEYIVKLIDIFYTFDTRNRIVQNLIFEYMYGSLENVLKQYIKDNLYIPIEDIKSFSLQIIKGLKEIHDKNIAHRDIKPENILFTYDGSLKISDFGSAKIIEANKNSSPFVISRYYRPPELILGSKNYGVKVDVFSAGCIIFELFTLTPLFRGKLEGLQIIEQMCILGNPGEKYFSSFDIPEKTIDFLSSIKIPKITDLKDILNPDNNYSKNDIELASDLILKMISWDVTKRFSASQCLNHPFLLEKAEN